MLSRFPPRLAAVALVAGAAFLPARALHAQSSLWRSVGSSRGDRVGSAVQSIADVDGDGRADLLIGATYGGPGFVGEVTLVSGATGALLLTFHGDRDHARFGARVADVGDVDGGGSRDVAVVAPDRRESSSSPAGALFVFDGATGALLRLLKNDFTGSKYWFGSDVAGIGDVDGDGHADFVSSYAIDFSIGNVVVVSGATGAIVRVHKGAATAFFGRDVDDAGDVDADGVRDYIVGAPRDHAAYVYSGASGQLLHTLADVTSTALYYGWAVAGAGDVDGDGHADLLVADPSYGGTYSGDEFDSGNGLIDLRSGATGAVLATAIGGAAEEVGFVLSRSGDLDGDAFPDFVATADVPPVVHAFSGATGAELKSFALGTCMDASLAAAFDLSGDGVCDVLAGLPEEGAADQDAGAGHAIAVDWSSGATLFESRGLAYSSHCGSSLAPIADRNGDGFRDVAVGCPGGDGSNLGAVRIVSGQDGSTLTTLRLGGAEDQFGSSLVEVGDVDGDLVPDLAIGAFLHPGVGRGRVEIRSGADDSLLRSFDAPAGANAYGFTLAAGLDRAGAPFLAINDPNFGTFPNVVGRLEIHDLAGGGPPLVITWTSPYDAFGYAIACAGDVDGDGILDWIVGMKLQGSSATDGSVTVYSGSDGHPLWSVQGTDGEQLGSSVAALADLDGDGAAEVLAGAAYGGPGKEGRVTCFSGADGSTELFTLVGADFQDRFGQSIASLGDLNRDGIGDFAVEAPGQGPGNGVVEIYSGRTASRLYRIDGVQDLSRGNELNSNVAWGGSSRIDPDRVPDLLTRSFQFSDGRAESQGELRKLDDLFVQIEPAAALPGASVDVHTRGGPDGKLVGVFAVAFDTTPLGFFLALGTFDALESYSFSGAVPSGLSGHSLTLRGYAIGYRGKLVDSQDAILTFR